MLAVIYGWINVLMIFATGENSANWRIDAVISYGFPGFSSAMILAFFNTFWHFSWQNNNKYGNVCLFGYSFLSIIIGARLSGPNTFDAVVFLIAGLTASHDKFRPSGFNSSNCLTAFQSSCRLHRLVQWLLYVKLFGTFSRLACRQSFFLLEAGFGRHLIFRTVVNGALKVVLPFFFVIGRLLV